MSHHKTTTPNHEISTCACGGCHTHAHTGEDQSDSTMIRLIAGAVFFAAALLLQHLGIGLGPFALPGTPAFPSWLNPVSLLFLIAFLISGYRVIFFAVKNIMHGRVFDENFLMSIASIGAFLIGEYPEGVAVMLFYGIGELLQERAVNKSKKSIEKMMDLRPDHANLLPRGAEGSDLSHYTADVQTVDPDVLVPGDIILIKPGEKVPVDCVILSGHSSVDVSALTGESLPADLSTGDELLSGCVNLSGLLYARVLHLFSESTVSKILDLVQNAGAKKSKSESFITKFARYYTPAVVAAAVLLAVLPPLLIPDATFHTWLYRALLFLVVSCPCALVISIPLSFFGGIGGAARHGILVKGGNYLDALAHAETVIFDKTGTLTKGVFQVAKICPEGMSGDELLRFAAHAEAFSNHPIAISLQVAYGQELSSAEVSDVEEVAGHGIKAVVAGHRILAGNQKLMRIAGLEKETGAASGEVGTVVHVAANDRYAGYIVIADEVKSDAAKAIADLRAVGIQKIAMLTGDSRAAADLIGAGIGLDEVHAELLPADKVTVAEDLLSKKSAKGTLIFAGDGINDAPVLARADIGIAMGGAGSDAAIEAADVVIMTDEPSKVALAVRIARHTIRIANQNIAFALGVKALVLVLGTIGVATMWQAIFADVGVSLIATLNALRAMHIKA